MQRTLLTKELDDALDAHENPEQKKDEQPKKSFWESIWESMFEADPESSPDPLKFLKDNVSLALIEAAAKNELSYVNRLAKISLASEDEYFEAIYFALVAAAQGGHSEVFNVFFTADFAHVIGLILERGMGNAHTISAVPNRFQSIDFTSSEAQVTQNLLAIRLGLSLNQLPDLMIEAAHYGRLDMVERLLSFMPLAYLNNNGYYPCLRAAEAGHVAVMEKFFEYESVRKEILSQGDAICYAAVRGRFAVVEKLLELHKYPMSRLLESALHYGSADIIERLLKEANIDNYLKYEGDDKGHINAIKKYGYFACYVNSSKSYETASQMFQMLLKYPVIAQLAEKNKNANDNNVVYAILKRLKMIPAKAIESTKIASSNSGFFLQSGLPAETVADEKQSKAESSYNFHY